MSNPARILFTIPNFITAGSGREMLNIVQRLDKKKYVPFICVRRKGGKMEDEIRRLGIPLVEAPFCIESRPIRSLLSRVREAAELFKPFKFKFFHSFHWAGDYTEPLIARFSNAKWIYTKKNMNWGNNWKIRSLLASKIVVRNSAMMKRFFNSPFYAKKATFIPGGVDAERFSSLMPKIPRMRDDYKVSKETILVTCVAQISPVKGQHLLLAAVQQIPQAHVFFAGRDSDTKYAKRLAVDAEQLKISRRVHFIGGVEDVPELLSETDIFVLPTTRYGGHEEGCPVALLEAMSARKSCVASDVSGSSDIIQDGVNGFLVPPENAEALADKIRLLAESEELRLKLGKAARQRILDHYTIEREVADHEALYEEILRK